MQPLKKIIVVLLLAPLLLAAGLLSHYYLEMVAALGRYIYQTDVEMDYFLGLLWALALGLGILLWPVPARHKPYLLLLWGAKVLVTLFLMLFYESFYPTLDAYSYHQVVVQPHFSFAGGFTLGEGTQNIIKLSRLLQFLAPGSYHGLKVSFAMIGLCGCYLFFRAVVIFTQKENMKVLLLLGLFPSMLFWSSILGKEPVVLMGTALYALGAAGLYQYRQLRYLLVLSAGIYLSMLVRIWLGPILLAPLIIFILFGVRSHVLKILIICIGAVAFLVSINQFLGQFNIESQQDVISRTNSLAQYFDSGGSKQEAPDISSIGAMLAFAPKGIFAALFRPLPGEVRNVFGLLAGMENLILLILLALALKRTRPAEWKQPPVLWAVTLLLCWATLYGYISYENLGTAVRYRLQIFPFLLCTLSYLSQRRQETGDKWAGEISALPGTAKGPQQTGPGAG